MSLTRRALFGSIAAVALAPAIGRAAATTWDCIVYGQTPAGIMAAIRAARNGLRTVLIGGPASFGGMVVNGILASDVNATAPVLRGITLEYFKKLESLTKINTIGFGLPSDKEQIFTEMCAEAGVSLYPDIEVSLIRRSGTLITGVKLEDGSEWTLSRYGVVIDASYEGDLMAMATSYWTFGRESAAQYGETLAGYNQVQHLHHQSPYIQGHSGPLLPGFVPAHSGVGTADRAIQAYTYRPTLTMDTANLVPFTEPTGYRAELYVWHRRLLSDTLDPPLTPTIENGVTYPYYDWDLSDFPGASWSYPTGDRATRAQVAANHVAFVKGWFWYFSTDPAVPKVWRDWYSSLGWLKSEYTDNDNFPRQLYVREGRRMVSQTLLRQADTQTNLIKKNSVAQGSHPLDCHQCQFIVYQDGTVNLEGTMGDPDTIGQTGLFDVPYEVMLPRDVDNMLVPICVSMSHVAFSAFRTEPTYMMMGDAAGLAAAMAVLDKESVRSLGAGVSSAVSREPQQTG